MKVIVKIDMREYYEITIKRLNHRIGVTKKYCLDKLESLSTLYDERTKLERLLGRMKCCTPKIKDPTPELTTKSKLLFHSQSSVTKTSPQEDSPQLMSPNNVRLTDNNLFGYKNRGEGVSKEVGNKSDGHFGNKNSDFSGVNDISNLLEMISPRKYNLSARTEWDLIEKDFAKVCMTRRAREVELVMKVLSGNNLPQASEMVLYIINRHPLL